MNRYLPIGEAASLLGVSIAQLRSLEDERKISPLFTLSGGRRYKLEDLQKLKAQTGLSAQTSPKHLMLDPQKH